MSKKESGFKTRMTRLSGTKKHLLIISIVLGLVVLCLPLFTEHVWADNAAKECKTEAIKHVQIDFKVEGSLFPYAPINYVENDEVNWAKLSEDGEAWIDELKEEGEINSAKAKTKKKELSTTIENAKKALKEKLDGESVDEKTKSVTNKRTEYEKLMFEDETNISKIGKFALLPIHFLPLLIYLIWYFVKLGGVAGGVGTRAKYFNIMKWAIPTAIISAVGGAFAYLLCGLFVTPMMLFIAIDVVLTFGLSIAMFKVGRPV